MVSAPQKSPALPETDQPIGVILAGGLAKRMGGGDKLLLRIGGKTIFEHLSERLAGQCKGLILNGNGPPERFIALGLPVIPDTIPDHAGPLAGILASLDWMAETHPTCETLLTVAGDTPFLPKDLVKRLEAGRQKAGTPLACAQSGAQRHPTLALWPVSLRFVLRDALVDEGLRKMEHFMARAGCTAVEWDTVPLDPFFNINQPEDVEEANRLLASLTESLGTGEGLKLDLKGLKCPLPALKTAKALARMKRGDEVRVVCTDPMAQIDIPHLVQSEGHQLIAQEVKADHLVFVIRKA
jgi:molybdopterin-guanine dinucleotide biosynthesis protein A